MIWRIVSFGISSRADLICVNSSCNCIIGIGTKKETHVVVSFNAIQAKSQLANDTHHSSKFIGLDGRLNQYSTLLNSFSLTLHFGQYMDPNTQCLPFPRHTPRMVHGVWDRERERKWWFIRYVMTMLVSAPIIIRLCRPWRELINSDAILKWMYLFNACSILNSLHTPGANSFVLFNEKAFHVGSSLLTINDGLHV